MDALLVHDLLLQSQSVESVSSGTQTKQNSMLTGRALKDVFFIFRSKKTIGSPKKEKTLVFEVAEIKLH